MASRTTQFTTHGQDAVVIAIDRRSNGRFSECNDQANLVVNSKLTWVASLADDDEPMDRDLDVVPYCAIDAAAAAAAPRNDHHSETSSAGLRLADGSVILEVEEATEQDDGYFHRCDKLADEFGEARQVTVAEPSWPFVALQWSMNDLRNDFASVLDWG